MNMNDSLKNIHLSSQYLAAAGKSFLENKDDDSQSNLAWHAASNSLVYRGLRKEIQLTLNLKKGYLIWLQDGSIQAQMDAQKHTHKEIINWISLNAISLGIDRPYVFETNYELDYPKQEDSSMLSFNLTHASILAQTFTLAQNCFISFINTNELTSEIRVWPHHFDLGIYTEIKPNFSLGAGLAIPDSLENELYFYASGWYKGQSVETKNLPKLEIGAWHQAWNGGTLKAANQTEESLEIFLNEVKSGFEMSVQT
jgi:hypothetical protein